MKSKRLSGLAFVFLIFVVLISDPVAILFYKLPLESELNYSKGIAHLKYGYKAGQRLRLETVNGVMVFVCRSASFGLMQTGTCPLNSDEEAEIEGKNITVGWYRQNRWPLTSSEMQIFSISDERGNIIKYNKMSDYYRIENRKIRVGPLVEILISFLFLVFVVVNIFRSTGDAKQ